MVDDQQKRAATFNIVPNCGDLLWRKGRPACRRCIGDDQKVYVIGDTVANNTTLRAVYADRVVLNEKGVLTNLKLPREFKEAQATNTRSTTRSTRQVSPPPEYLRT